MTELQTSGEGYLRVHRLTCIKKKKNLKAILFLNYQLAYIGISSIRRGDLMSGAASQLGGLDLPFLPSESTLREPRSFMNNDVGLLIQLGPF